MVDLAGGKKRKWKKLKCQHASARLLVQVIKDKKRQEGRKGCGELREKEIRRWARLFFSDYRICNKRSSIFLTQKIQQRDCVWNVCV